MFSSVRNTYNKIGTGPHNLKTTSFWSTLMDSLLLLLKSAKLLALPYRWMSFPSCLQLRHAEILLHLSLPNTGLIFSTLQFSRQILQGRESGIIRCKNHCFHGNPHTRHEQADCVCQTSLQNVDGKVHLNATSFGIKMFFIRFSIMLWVKNLGVTCRSN